MSALASTFLFHSFLPVYRRAGFNYMLSSAICLHPFSFILFLHAGTTLTTSLLSHLFPCFIFGSSCLYPAKGVLFWHILAHPGIVLPLRVILTDCSRVVIKHKVTTHSASERNITSDLNIVSHTVQDRIALNMRLGLTSRQTIQLVKVEFSSRFPSQTSQVGIFIGLHDILTAISWLSSVCRREF
jgi:hypothetical protein